MGGLGLGDWGTKGLGTILADRPKSVLVHSETHEMSLLRYVHNNPVRAGVVERASDKVNILETATS